MIFEVLPPGGLSRRLVATRVGTEPHIISMLVGLRCRGVQSSTLLSVKVEYWRRTDEA